jgi:hypothetical protein
MARTKPKLDSSLPTKDRLRPKPTKAGNEQNWTFNFRFFRQIEYFGLDGANLNANWFASLLSRFADLSNRKLSQFMQDSSAQSQSGYRFHHINWEQKNIPIQRKDINWLPMDYLDNDDEYPLFQFQVSKSTGRVIGFFDEHWQFNVLLLDPLHNIQPSKSHAYSVDPCSPMACDYTRLIAGYEAITSASCNNEECGYHLQISKSTPSIISPENALVHYIDNDLASAAQKLVDDGKVTSFLDIFESGVITLMD